MDGFIHVPILGDILRDAETITVEVSTRPEYWGGEVPEDLLMAFAAFLRKKAAEWGYRVRILFTDSEPCNEERARELLQFAWSEFFNSGLADLYDAGGER